MEVPQGERWRLLATFNSGFLTRDSGGGFYLEWRQRSATAYTARELLAFKNGRVDIVSWKGGVTPGQRLSSQSRTFR